MCDDVALGPGEGFRLHSDQNCPGIPALLDSRTGTVPVERTHKHPLIRISEQISILLKSVYISSKSEKKNENEIKLKVK